MNQNEMLNLFAQEITTKLGDRVKKIILFGSRARGNDEPDSDYDLLVVLNDISPLIKDRMFFMKSAVNFSMSITLCCLFFR